MDMDRIVLMGGGRVLEQGSPVDLANLKGGRLKDMLDAAKLTYG